MIKIKEKGKGEYWYNFGFGISTDYYWDEGEQYNSINISGFGYYAYIRIPALIKPKIIHKSFTDANGIVSGYKDTIAKEYGIRVWEDHVVVHHGIQPGCWTRDDPENSDHTSSWTIPWKSFYRVKNVLVLPTIYGPQTLIEEPEGKFSETRGIREAQREIIKKHSKYVFNFTDYDSEENTARVYTSVGTFRANGGKSNGFWGFMTKFMKPKIHVYAEIIFDKGMGRRKGSWKGGTMEIHAPIKDDESPKQAAIRILTEEGATNIRYVGVM